MDIYGKEQAKYDNNIQKVSHSEFLLTPTKPGSARRGSELFQFNTMEK